MIEFEWDPEKAAGNLQKHGISFEVAVEIFFSTHHISEDARTEYGEKRYIAVGTTGDMTLTVVFTPRGKAFRIISARKARRNERKKTIS